MCGAALSPRNVPEGSDGGACRSARNHLWGMLTSRNGCAVADPRGSRGRCRWCWFGAATMLGLMLSCTESPMHVTMRSRRDGNRIVGANNYAFGETQSEAGLDIEKHIQISNSSTDNARI